MHEYHISIKNVTFNFCKYSNLKEIKKIRTEFNENFVYYIRNYL